MFSPAPALERPREEEKRDPGNEVVALYNVEFLEALTSDETRISEG